MFSRILPFILATDTGKDQSEVSVQRLTKLIDSFCFYPVKVNLIKNKNSSEAFTSIYAQNRYNGRKDTQGIIEKKHTVKVPAEARLV